MMKNKVCECFAESLQPAIILSNIYFQYKAGADPEISYGGAKIRKLRAERISGLKKKLDA